MDRKSTQRERLMVGMTEVAAREGYAAASVARVIARAGVSRPTFYDYFAHREDCFLSTHRALASDLLDRVHRSVQAEDPTRSVQAALTAIVEFACAEPIPACLLMQEAMAAGPDARDERDRTIKKIAKIVEGARAQAPADAITPDLSVTALTGGVYRLLSMRLRRGERDLEPFVRDLGLWLAAYEQPTSEHRWRTLRAGTAPTPSPGMPELSELLWSAPPPLRRGRNRASDGEVSQNQRERIMVAALQVAHEQGYLETTIADIATAAQVDRRVFYHHFQSKQDAFLATLERGAQQMLGVAAGAFFSAPTWPERVWEAGHAFTRFQAANVALADVALIEAYAIGPTAVQRFEELRTAFTIFLQEGHQHQRDGTAPVSSPVLEAIAATVFEIVYHEIRHGRTDQLARLLPHVAHLCLAPFLGVAATDAFILTKSSLSSATRS